MNLKCTKDSFEVNSDEWSDNHEDIGREKRSKYGDANYHLKIYVYLISTYCTKMQRSINFEVH